VTCQPVNSEAAAIATVPVDLSPRETTTLTEVLDALCALGPVGCAPGASAWTFWNASTEASVDWLGRIAAAQTYAYQQQGDGVFERSRFEGPAGTISLMLLPDTDFLAWDVLVQRLAATLPRRAGRVQVDRRAIHVCRFESVIMRQSRLVGIQPATLSACGRCALKLFAMEGVSRPDH
jgi:hypothetical protein